MNGEGNVTGPGAGWKGGVVDLFNRDWGRDAVRVQAISTAVRHEHVLARGIKNGFVWV